MNLKIKAAALTLMTTLSLGCTNPFSSTNSFVGDHFDVGGPDSLVAEDTTSSMPENITSYPVHFPYKNSTIKAVSCSISNLSHMSIVTPCGCTAGACIVILKPDLNFFGTVEFSFTLVDQKGRSSNAATARINITERNLAYSAHIAPSTSAAGSQLSATVKVNSSSLLSGSNLSGNVSISNGRE